MNKFNTLEIFQINKENKEKKELNEMNNNKYKNKEIYLKNNNSTKKRENLTNSNQLFQKLDFLPNLSHTIKTNNYLICSFRAKYTSEKLKSIQISSYDNNINLNNNITNNSNDNNDKYNKNLFSKSFGSINIVKSIDSINTLNSNNNNFIATSKNHSNDKDNKINEEEKPKKKDIRTIKVFQKEKRKIENNNIYKNNYILNPDYYCTYNFPFKELSYDEEIKRNVNKFNSFVQRKKNVQKYSNLSMIPNQFINKKNIFIENDNKGNNNFISISDNIEESIHSNFSNYENKIKSDKNKQLSKSGNYTKKKIVITI